MPELSKEQINELVARATKTVFNEMQAGEAKVFEVSDLNERLVDLSKVGGQAAWEISYKTSHAALGGPGDPARPGSTVAWEISYKTSSASFDRSGPVQ